MQLSFHVGSATGALRRVRWPAIALAAGAGFALVVAAAPAYASFPWRRPDGWASPALVLALLVYLALTGVLFVASCADVLRRSLGPRPVDAAVPADVVEEAPEARAPVMWVALGLAALVLLHTEVRLGTGSGAWATSRPAHELHATSADGFVAWIDGRPVHQESLYAWHQVMTLLSRQPRSPISFQEGIARPGNAAYAFLTALVAPVAGWPAGLYGAFVLVNAVTWWVAALCLFDLARRATGSWWAGVAGGVLTAAGTGFVFGATNALSGTAAYAVVACVLWLVHRLRVFSAEARVRDLVLVAWIASMAGLFYGIALLYVVLGAVLFVGRTELRRLVVWAAAVLLVGQVWSTLLRLAVWQADPALPAPGVSSALALVGLAALVVALGAAPARWVDPLLAGGVLLGLVAALGVVVLAPGLLRQAANAMTETLHLPRYLGDAGDVMAQVGAQFFGSWQELPERLREHQLDGNFLAAFPAGVAMLALAGLAFLPRRWSEWCLGIVAVVAAITLVYNEVSGVHHPRLAYFAWPGMYVAAAAGVRGLAWLAYAGAVGLLRLPHRAALALAVAVAATCIAPVVLGASAPLWGDWSLDDAFHYLNEAH